MAIAKLMKGHSFKKAKHKMTYPAVAEYKYDEIRLDVRKGPGGLVFQSYADTPLHNLMHFGDRFYDAMGSLSLSRLDMGVLVNGSYGDTYRYVRSSTGLPEDLEVRSIDFILFDVPQHSTWAFRERMHKLDETAHWLRKFALPVMRPLRVEVFSEDDVWQAYQNAVDTGYEGLMVKSLDHVYQLDKRINGWLKVKPEDTIDGVITGINQAISIVGEPLDRAGSVSIRFEDGSIADAGGIKHGLASLMWEYPDQFLGEWCEMAYMMRDRQGGYRHPIFKRLREAKA